MQGLVTKSTGSGYRVLLDDGSSVLCHVKGNLRIRGIRTTNPVAVGDRVEVDGEWITTILPRRNYIIRRATNLSKQAHILAANIDQVALLVTINHPVTSTTFIDRFLATAEAYRIPAVLIFNKVDLLTPDELVTLNDLRALYESLNYPTYAISAKNINSQSAPDSQSPSQSNSDRPLLPITYNLLPITELFRGKTTLLSGNSGVGKSTLLNALFGRELTRTADLSDAHDTGMHTTTFSEMYPLPNSSQPDSDSHLSPITDNLLPTQAVGWVIDIPGVKGFGSVEMEPHEVSHYFREIFRIGRSCRYSDCLHVNEPGCAVREALTDNQSEITNQIVFSRYESYLSMLGDNTEQKYR